jgi:hypothetical protein
MSTVQPNDPFSIPDLTQKPSVPVQPELGGTQIDKPSSTPTDKLNTTKVTLPTVSGGSVKLALPHLGKH